MRKIILSIIDFFYPPFSKFISIHNFRYLCTGGSTLVVGILMFFIAYNFILHQQDVLLPFNKTLNSVTAAFIIETSITIPYGFLMNKYIIFSQSELKGRKQLFRYILLVLISMAMNYVLLRIFTRFLGIYPTVSKAIISVGMAAFSYFYQHYVTFEVKKIK
ncbi:MAG: GtrA family protein [Sphingobacteriaceae bacterium]|nr:GtrA family protein [Sphingobacteriaceae bacterium]